MDFFLANQLLENARDDLEYGALADAQLGLQELARLSEDVAPQTGARKWQKVRPGTIDVLKKAKNADAVKPTAPGSDGKAPMHVSFRSTLRQWKEQLESGGDDSPEALGGFLHRHFGHLNWDHEKVSRIARRAHKADKETARRAADHYIALKGKNEAVKTKMRFYRRNHQPEPEPRKSEPPPKKAPEPQPPGRS